MIDSFKHKGLKRLYGKGDSSKLSAELLPKINRIVSLLDMATELEDQDLPGFRLHALKDPYAERRGLSRPQRGPVRLAV